MKTLLSKLWRWIRPTRAPIRPKQPSKLEKETVLYWSEKAARASLAHHAAIHFGSPETIQQTKRELQFSAYRLRKEGRQAGIKIK